MISPMIRNNICLNAHPEGCAASVKNQIAYVKAKGQLKSGPKNVLVLGCSTGYGLASRIAAAFGSGAATIGVSFEREGSETKPATPGFYNNRAFDKEAAAAGLKAFTFNLDAFADSTREAVIAKAKEFLGPIDLVVYSLASPVRTYPEGKMWKSCIKPIGQTYSGSLVDMMTGKMSTVTIESANEEEIEGCVKVMGGEDWELWMKALKSAGVLAPGCATVAYSYIGPALSFPIYRAGSLGRAKEHLEKTALSMTRDLLVDLKGSAYVSINKALVTRASAVIPAIPLYVMALYRVMKDKGIHEGCIEQISRLYRDFLYAGKAVPVDGSGRIRIDDWEMRDDVQNEVEKIMAKADDGNLGSIADLAGFRADFLEAHGFGMPGIDYEKPVSYL